MDMNLGKITLGTIIAIFIGVIFVMAIMPAIADQTGIMTTKSTVTNEAVDITTARPNSTTTNSSITFTVTNAPTGWKTTECPLTSVVYGNSSVDFTVTTDYSVAASTGVITLVPTEIMNRSGNDTLIDYINCRDGYTTGASQTMINLILLFAGLAVIASVLFYLFKR